jgi:hypothetical protein
MSLALASVFHRPHKARPMLLPLPTNLSDTAAELFALDERIAHARGKIAELSNRMAIAAAANSEERIANMLTDAEVELFNLLGMRKKLIAE